MPKHYLTVHVEDMPLVTKLDQMAAPGQYRGAPSITIHVAKMGTRLASNEESKYGHVFISVTKQVDGVFQTKSIGFSAGESLRTSRDNLSFDDHINYSNASTNTITSRNPMFVTAVDKVLDKIKKYREEELEAPEYDLLDNNCTHFAEKILNESGLDIKLPWSPDVVEEQLEEIGTTFMTPIAIDINGDGIETIPIGSGVWFDLDADGVNERVGWLSSKDGFLIIDKNKNGLVDNGSELFGDAYLLKNGELARDGFEAMLDIDSDGNMKLNSLDEKWGDLRFWRDMNTDGVSDETELFYLDDLGLQEIDLSPVIQRSYDNYGNIHGPTSIAFWANGTETKVTDMFFAYA